MRSLQHGTAYACRRDQVTTSAALPIRSGPGINEGRLTEQDMGNNRLFSRCCPVFFSSVPSKPRCINPIEAWLHGIYQCYVSLVSRLFLVAYLRRVMKEEESKTEDCLSLWSGEDCSFKTLFHLYIVCMRCITL